ncbi:hypothetical protein KDA_56720 [Dictyobacter alpinus]|uniref:Methyltransferase type 12 domain-containing protein n=1 Tax=Dictyobacter alpinus TaxID=2014873 RepID=A0A402BFL7_9CHLR|nr:class I SAM-dependent methyltransferase [Dictyobacter alpinus]GCE30188.1 hypothetical protein KDA_56720 [Dictyobacter alpinus]
MQSYYSGKRASAYNRSWKTFSEKTLAATISTIDLSSLKRVARLQSRSSHILDVACGTGLLLERLGRLVPEAELYGLDVSPDMLSQARQLLEHHPHTHFVQVALNATGMSSLPYAPATFDLITCTNALHYLDDPVAVLQGLKLLLVPHGQLVLEDYARRTFPLPWRLFEWLIKRVDPQHIRAYTLSEAMHLCQKAGLQVVEAKNISIDALWQGWVMRMVSI